MDFSPVSCSDLHATIRRADDQRGGVPPVVMQTGVEVGVEGLGEGAAAVGVDVSLRVRVIEGHGSVLVVQEDGDSLWGLQQGQGHGGASTGAQAAAFTPADRPVTAVGTHRDDALPVDGLPGYTQIPLALMSDLKHRTQSQNDDISTCNINVLC